VRRIGDELADRSRHRAQIIQPSAVDAHARQAGRAGCRPEITDSRSSKGRLAMSASTCAQPSVATMKTPELPSDSMP
jgi:hypothetical protein